jgi:hypothetical protein
MQEQSLGTEGTCRNMVKRMREYVRNDFSDNGSM